MSRDLQAKYGRKPSAIDTIQDRKQYDIMDHEDALLRLGTGYVSHRLVVSMINSLLKLDWPQLTSGNVSDSRVTLQWLLFRAA